MVLVKKGNQTFLVSMGAYNDTFKKLGYEIIENNKEEVSKNTSSAQKKHKLEEEKELIENEKKENETKLEGNKDVVTSEKLTGPIGKKIEDDFGFETTNLENNNDKYQEKLNSLKENSKSGK